MVPVQVTSGEFDEGNATWSKDGAGMYFISTRVAEPYYDPPISELYRIQAKGGAIEKVTGIQGQIGDYALSSDGKMIAFTGVLSRPVLSYSEPHVYVVSSAAGSTPKELAQNSDLDFGEGVIGDQHPPRAEGNAGIFWAGDGKSVVQLVAEKGTANLRQIDVASGRVTPITTGNHEIMTWTATPDGSKVVVNISTTTNIGDLFLLGQGGRLTRLTNSNERLLAELN